MANIISIFLSIPALLFFLCGDVLAQATTQNRIEQKIPKNEKEVFYINMLHKIAEEKITADTTMALRCIREALAISEKINYSYGKAMSYHLLGALFDFRNITPGKGISYYKKSASIASELDSLRLAAKNYLSIGKVFQRMGLFNYASQYLLLSLQVYKKKNDPLNCAIAHTNIASNYAEWNDETYKLSLQHFDSALQKGNKLESRLVYVCAVRALTTALIAHKEFKNAEIYLKKAIPIAESDRTLTKFLPRLYCNNGKVLLENREMNTALIYFEKAKKIYEQEDHQSGKAHVLTLIAQYHHLTGNDQLARQHYLNALIEAQKANLRTTTAAIYDSLSRLATRHNEFKNAFTYKSTQLAYLDTIKEEQQHQLFAEAAWQLTTVHNVAPPENKNNQHISYVYWRIVLIAMITLSFLTIFYLSLRLHKAIKDKTAVTKDKAALASKNVVLEKELISKRSEKKQLEEQMESHAKTLTANSLNLIQKNEILKNIKAKAEEIKKASPFELPSRVNNLINTVNFALNIDKDWEHFKLHFEQVHNNFFDNLKAKYPGLNSNDLKLCALLKLNLDTKEIATVMDISPESVKVARSRLRKKLHLDPSENLSSFITQI